MVLIYHDFRVGEAKLNVRPVPVGHVHRYDLDVLVVIDHRTNRTDNIIPAVRRRHLQQSAGLDVNEHGAHIMDDVLFVQAENTRSHNRRSGGLNLLGIVVKKVCDLGGRDAIRIGDFFERSDKGISLDLFHHPGGHLRIFGNAIEAMVESPPAILATIPGRLQKQIYLDNTSIHIMDQPRLLRLTVDGDMGRPAMRAAAAVAVGRLTLDNPIRRTVGRHIRGYLLYPFEVQMRRGLFHHIIFLERDHFRCRQQVQLLYRRQTASLFHRKARPYSLFYAL